MGPVCLADLYVLVCPVVILVKGLEPSSIIMAVGHQMDVQPGTGVPKAMQQMDGFGMWMGRGFCLDGMGLLRMRCVLGARLKSLCSTQTPQVTLHTPQFTLVLVHAESRFPPVEPWCFSCALEGS